MDNGSDGSSTGPVRGTSISLEKSYFRLTSAPKPSDVRPLVVLQVSLAAYPAAANSCAALYWYVA